MSKSMRKRLQAQGVADTEIDGMIEALREAIMADILGLTVKPSGLMKRSLAEAIDEVIAAMEKEVGNGEPEGKTDAGDSGRNGC